MWCRIARSDIQPPRGAAGFTLIEVLVAIAVLAVVLGAIGLVFVFWGINWTFGAPNYAAKVNGVEITGNDVREAYQRELAQVERQTNGQVDDAQRNQIKRRVLDDFVSREALITRAADLGYRVSDPDILAAMAQIPAFQVEGTTAW